MRQPEIKSLAEAAYFSFTKSYATHARGTKHIFHLSKLHLGHLAKSFALRETPSKIIEKEKEFRREKREEKEEADSNVRHRNNNFGFQEPEPAFKPNSFVKKSSGGKKRKPEEKKDGIPEDIRQFVKKAKSDRGVNKEKKASLGSFANRSAMNSTSEFGDGF